MENFPNPKFCILEMSFIFLMSPATSEKESAIIHIFDEFPAISSEILLVPLLSSFSDTPNVHILGTLILSH